MAAMDEERLAEAGVWAAVLLALTLAVAGGVSGTAEPDPWPIGTDWTFCE